MKKQQQQQQQQIKRLYKEKTFVLVYSIQSPSEHSQNDTNKRSQQTEKPALSLR